MDLSRRNFLKFSTVAGVVGASSASRQAHAWHTKPVSPDWEGVLVDTTVCIGCRKCEWACNLANDLPAKPLIEYDDKTVFDAMRRPDAGAYTVVNRFENSKRPEVPYYVKVQCMHCNDAACVSACIVGALTKEEKTGTVHYDAWKCIGCRYCMAACPFQIPGYEYQNALTPQVRKCTFCLERISKEGGIPACVAICPVEALSYGKRKDLIELAHQKIAKDPDRYLDHVYGEKELGGTSWLYVSGKPMEQLGLLKFGERPIPSYTEPLQHGIFKHYIPPVSLFAFLGAIMWLFKKNDAKHSLKGESE